MTPDGRRLQRLLYHPVVYTLLALVVLVLLWPWTIFILIAAGAIWQARPDDVRR